MSASGQPKPGLPRPFPKPKPSPRPPTKATGEEIRSCATTSTGCNGHGSGRGLALSPDVPARYPTRQVERASQVELSERSKTIIRAHEEWQAANPANELMIYDEGLCYASVCTSLGDEELDRRMAARPATETRGWVRSEDTHFVGGQPNPCPCEHRPETHRHVLFEA